MNQYHKIQGLFKRYRPDYHTNLPKNKRYGSFIDGEWAIPEIEYLANNDWIWTEKLDGTNIRIIWQPQETEPILIKGKSDRAEIPRFLMKALEDIFTYDRMQVLEEMEMCLYGEGVGAKIQKGGGNYMPDGTGNSFVLFDIKIGRWWLKRKDVFDFAEKLGIQVAPVIGHGTLYEAIEETKKGFNSQWGDFLAEGMVCRPQVELFARNGERIIAKVKYKDFQ